MKDSGNRRPRLALPFSILADSDAVRLVAGEDFRYTIAGPNLQLWLPGLLKLLDGRHSLDELLTQLAEPLRAPARQIMERLYGERALVDGTPSDNHEARDLRPVIEGCGPLCQALTATFASMPATCNPVVIFSQDRLDYEAALGVNRRCRAERIPWLWTSSGAMSRGYVSPLFLPEAGPCLECLVRQFQRLSPAPEIYDALRDQARRKEPIEPVPFAAECLDILKQLVLRKLSWIERPDAPPALYRLHVLEVASMEITTHRVFIDPQCPACSEAA